MAPKIIIVDCNIQVYQEILSKNTETNKFIFFIYLMSKPTIATLLHRL